MAILTTGQITIVDNNDAKPITMYITASGPIQQIFTKDSGSTVYSPNWDSGVTQGSTPGSPLVLTAYAYVGDVAGVKNITNSLTERKWAYSIDGTAITTGSASSDFFVTSAGTTHTTTVTLPDASSTNPSTLTINANILEGIAPITIYFSGNYTDPVTTLQVKISANITISQVKTGTNAVWVRISGQDAFKVSTSGQAALKSTAVLYSDLMRPALNINNGVDDTNVKYEWYSQTLESEQLDMNLAGLTGAYAFLDTNTVNKFKATPNSVYNSAALDATSVGYFYSTDNSGTTTRVALSSSNINGWSDAKGMLIHQDAVNSLGIYEARIKDLDTNIIYSAYITVKDVSDPYALVIYSTAGDKLQNGQGTTKLIPRVYNGGVEVTNLLGWTFLWHLFDKYGNRCGLINTTNTVSATGWYIRSHTSGATATFTLGNNDGSAITNPSTNPTVSQGSLIKVVKPNGIDSSYYQVDSINASTHTITIRAATGNYDYNPITKTVSADITSWINFDIFPYPANSTDYVAGRLFVCDYYVKTDGQNNGELSAQGTNTATLDYSASSAAGNEVNAKATWTCTGIQS